MQIVSISSLPAPSNSVFCAYCGEATTDYITQTLPPFPTGWVPGRRKPRGTQRHTCAACQAAHVIEEAEADAEQVLLDAEAAALEAAAG